MTVLWPSVSVAAKPPAPVQAAAGWRGREGLVFLDSSMVESAGASMLAAEPVEVLRGDLTADGEELRARLKEHRGEEGGLFGWVGYDGKFVFGHYPRFFEFDHGTGRWRGEEPEVCPRDAVWDGCGGPDLAFRPLITREEFIDRVRRALDYIAAGDVYQVNLSYAWEAAWPDDVDAWAFYERLRRVSPAPYGAYFDLGGVQVCGASPECFLAMKGGQVVTRPIKGTRPRGRDTEADHRQARELMRSEKERAELVMITDLLRNDLGQVCEFGSVRVTGLCELERYSQVQHLVSTVEGVLRPEVDHVEALRRCFPGGSISGAPKRRALEIIAELELHERGLYTGAMGYFGFKGESRFNIAIRTAWRNGGVMRFHTGAGIVADSVPELEWEETWHKAAGLLQAARVWT